MSKEYISAESTQLEKEKKRLDRQYLKQRVEYLKQSRKIMERQRDALVKENKELKAKIESMVEPEKDEEVELPPQTSDLGTMYGSSDSWTLTTNADSNTQKSYERFSDAIQKSKEMAFNQGFEKNVVRAWYQRPHFRRSTARPWYTFKNNGGSVC